MNVNSCDFKVGDLVESNREGSSKGIYLCVRIVKLGRSDLDLAEVIGLKKSTPLGLPIVDGHGHIYSDYYNFFDLVSEF